MTHTPPQSPQPPSNRFQRTLDWIERVGNRLPDPLTLFFLLAIITIGLSAIAAWANLTVVNPANQETVAAISLLSGEGIRRIVTEAVTNFVEFPPLGTVLVALLGVGVAEQTGLLAAALRQLVIIAPARFLSPVVVFAGVMSNLAADAGYVVLIPLGAIIFLAFKRHPLAGLAAAFAGVSGGYSANLLIGPLDPLLAGLSQSAAQLISPNYIVDATANYYFMIASTFVVTLVGWYVTDRIVEPRLGAYSAEEAIAVDQPALSAPERKGLRWAGYALLAYVAFILLLVLPPQAVLREPETFTLVPSPFIRGIVFIITLGFLIPGIAYGKASGSVRSDRDVAEGMAKAMSAMGYYIVLAFIAAQFIAYFEWSNLGVILAINGADFLRSTGMSGPPILILFILLSVILDLFIGSASAKWAIMAPVFVPMLMLVGLSPEAVQAAYRIGDSTTNIITPLMPYFPVVLAFGHKYDNQMGIGKLIALMLPYSLGFLVAWAALFLLWYTLGIPLGPGAPVRI